MLVATDSLLDRLGDPALRICDVRWFLTEPGRGRAEYERGHIPGAIFVDVDRDLVAKEGPGRHPLPSPADFARRMGELGIGGEHEVIVYDQGGGTIAARLWWMLDAVGHARVSLLDGGFAAWRATGGRVDSRPALPAPTRLVPAVSAWPATIEREELAAALGRLRIVDVRAAERYRGEIEPIDPVAGHIPTAVNLPTTAHLDAEGRFRSSADIAETLRAVGIAGGPDTVIHCGSGVNACHTLFAMRLAGLPAPRLYPGSYSDWSRSGMPVVTGES